MSKYHGKNCNITKLKRSHRSLPWKVLSFANYILIAQFCTCPLERNTFSSST